MINNFSDLPLPDLTNTRYRHRPYADDHFIVNNVIRSVWEQGGYGNWHLPIRGTKSHLVRLYNGGRLNVSYPPSGMIELNAPLYPDGHELTSALLNKHTAENWFHDRMVQHWGKQADRHYPREWGEARLKRVFRSAFEESEIADLAIEDINAKLDLWESLTHAHVFPIVRAYRDEFNWCMALYISPSGTFFKQAWPEAIVMGKKNYGIHPYTAYEALPEPVSLLGENDNVGEREGEHALDQA